MPRGLDRRSSAGSRRRSAARAPTKRWATSSSTRATRGPSCWRRSSAAPSTTTRPSRAGLFFAARTEPRVAAAPRPRRGYSGGDEYARTHERRIARQVHQLREAHDRGQPTGRPRVGAPEFDKGRRSSGVGRGRARRAKTPRPAARSSAPSRRRSRARRRVARFPLHRPPPRSTQARCSWRRSGSASSRRRSSSARGASASGRTSSASCGPSSRRS